MNFSRNVSERYAGRMTPPRFKLNDRVSSVRLANRKFDASCIGQTIQRILNTKAATTQILTQFRGTHRLNTSAAMIRIVEVRAQFWGLKYLSSKPRSGEHAKLLYVRGYDTCAHDRFPPPCGLYFLNFGLCGGWWMVGGTW